MSACGKSLGRCSWNSVSQAMITVTGAAMVLSTFPGAKTGLRSALAPGVVRKTNLAGEHWRWSAQDAPIHTPYAEAPQALVLEATSSASALREIAGRGPPVRSAL